MQNSSIDDQTLLTAVFIPGVRHRHIMHVFAERYAL